MTDLWPSGCHRNKNAYHDKHWASFIPNTRSISDFNFFFRFWNTLHIHDELCWRKNSGLTMKFIWVACLCHIDSLEVTWWSISRAPVLLDPLSFIRGIFHLCRVGLRKFQILCHFTFGDLEFGETQLILIPRSTWQPLLCSRPKLTPWRPVGRYGTFPGILKPQLKTAGKSLLPRFPDAGKS